MLTSLTTALAMIVATTGAAQLTSQTQSWNKAGGYLVQGDILEAGQSISSGKYNCKMNRCNQNRLHLTTDCNLELFHKDKAGKSKRIW